MLGSLVRGAIAGAVGTWVMDLVTTGLAASESEADKAREADARPNGRSATANLAVLIASRLGIAPSDEQVSTAATALHWGLGIVPGALYGALHRHVPLLDAGRGLAFGATLFLANDEAMNTALGLSGPPRAYPLSTHVRGAVGHLVLGATIDALVAIFEG